MKKILLLALFLFLPALASGQVVTVTPKLTWTNPVVSGPFTVRVERQTDGGAFVTACTVTPTLPTSQCLDAPQPVGHTYVYRAIATNQFGDSPPSNTATLAALGPGAPTTFGLTFTIP